MNEVKHIHLGRQQFTVSTDAHTELREYLDAIKKQAGRSGGDVVEEVEARMAELLTERGVKGEKVVLPSDVNFLKQQLGEPSDFKADDETEPEKAETTAEKTTKRLFRDTEHGMIAGVAAGLGAYLGIDTVIVRLVFLLLTLASGAGIVLYIILWLIAPEAKTTSDKLQMQGHAVTLDNLKKVVEQADVPGAAHRAGSSFGRVVAFFFKFVLTAAGIVITILASLGVLWTIFATVYCLINGAKVAGTVVFPIGVHEVLAFAAAMVTAFIVMISLVLVGVAMVRRRWQLPAWGVATLVGLFVVAAGLSGALAATVVPEVHDRVEALHHSKVVNLPKFSQAQLTGNDTRFSFVPDSKYFVEYHYLGNTDTALIKTSVTGGVLRLGTGAFAEKQLCSGLCVFRGPDLQITVHAPALDSVTVKGDQASFYNQDTLSQAAMTLNVQRGASANLVGTYPLKAVLADDVSDMQHLEMTLQNTPYNDDYVSVDSGGYVELSRAGELDVNGDVSCRPGNAYIFIANGVSALQIGGKTLTGREIDAFEALQSSDRNSAYNCVALYTETPMFVKPYPPMQRPW